MRSADSATGQMRRKPRLALLTRIRWAPAAGAACRGRTWAKLGSQHQHHHKTSRRLLETENTVN